MDIWDIVKSINNKTILNTDDIEKVYLPYIINKNFSYYSDTIFYANEMNIHSELDKDIQYNFLLNIIRPKKRWSKWVKKQNLQNVELIKSYYNCNEKRAFEILEILNPQQIKEIKEDLNTGGNDE